MFERGRQGVGRPDRERLGLSRSGQTTRRLRRPLCQQAERHGQLERTKHDTQEKPNPIAHSTNLPQLEEPSAANVARAENAEACATQIVSGGSRR
jgi:hypothetical protein